jgi:hypothetical protein
MGMMVPMKHNHNGIKIEDSIIDRIKAAVPAIMERKGFPKGEVTVTTSPDIKFPVEAEGKLWTAGNLQPDHHNRQRNRRAGTK